MQISIPFINWRHMMQTASQRAFFQSPTFNQLLRHSPVADTCISKQHCIDELREHSHACLHLTKYTNTCILLCRTSALNLLTWALLTASMLLHSCQLVSPLWTSHKTLSPPNSHYYFTVLWMKVYAEFLLYLIGKYFSYFYVKK